MASKSPGDQYGGAGLSLASPESTTHNKSDSISQQSLASRAIALSTYFLSGALCINLSQFLGTPLYLINQDWYNAWIAFTKQSFGLLTMTLTQAFSPTKVIVSGDASVRGQILRKTDGNLLLDFPERIVLIANHQIYTDWLYLWWTAYCSGMHGRLYIILKESLKRIPVIGWGMQFNQFIFLKRDWEKDREHMAQALGRLNKLTDPMWLLLFPEGTNLAQSTREKSAKWASKTKTRDMRHCLLPRSTGLRFCLQELRETVDYLYDCTIAYEGVPRGAYAQDIFTLRTGYLEGRPPKSVSMYWRRFAIKDIPIDNDKAFELWLIARWREKDLLIENYLIHGHFPADAGVSKTPAGQTKRGAGRLTVEIRSSHWYEFLQIFAPMGILAMVLYCFYGALPQKFFKSETGKAVKESTEDIKALKNSNISSSMPTSFDLDAIFDKDKQSQTFGKAGVALAQWIQTPEAKRMVDRADLVQKWLKDPQKVLLESLTGGADKQNYLKLLKEEENKRKRLSNKHQGTFWSDLEKSGGSKTSSQPATGTFYAELARAQNLKTSPAPQKLTKANLEKRSNFQGKMQKELSRRAGTVYTLPSISSSSSRTTLGSYHTDSQTFTNSVGSSKRLKMATATPKSSTYSASRTPSVPVGKTAPVSSRPSPVYKKPVATKSVRPMQEKQQIKAPKSSSTMGMSSSTNGAKKAVQAVNSKAPVALIKSKVTTTALRKPPVSNVSKLPPKTSSKAPLIPVKK